MGKRVLIVDDSRVSRLMTKARMQALQPQWVFEEASSGEEALEKVAQCAPDFVTMDINMPGLNGFEAAQQLLQRVPQAQVVLLTANVQISSQQRAQALGLRFVRKPVTDASVAEVVQHFLEQA